MLENNSDYLVEVDSSHQVSVKIEMTFTEPMNKVKAKSFVFTLFDELDINDENDLFSISYATHKQTKQIHKMNIHFKTVTAGNKFFEKIDSEKENLKLTNLIKNLIEKSSDDANEEVDDQDLVQLQDESLISTHLASSNVSTDSICVINDMAYSYIENSSLIIETSYYDVDTVSPSTTTSSSFKSNSTNQSKSDEQYKQEESLETLKPEIMIESTSSGSRSLETKPDNYYLELNLNKKLDNDDLDTLIIFLENEAANNLFSTESSDIIDYQVDHNGYQLNIKFESILSTEYLLNKKILKFKDYKLQIAKKFVKSNKNFKDNNNNDNLNRTLILSNIPNDLDLNMIKMYGENIASTKVKSIYPSRIFNDTYVLKFNDDLNMDLVRQRLSRRPMLRNQQVDLVLPEKTNILLLYKPNLNELDSLVWLNGSFRSIHKRNSFYFVEFETDLAKSNFEAKLNCTDSLLIREDLLNYEFLSRRSITIRANTNKSIHKNNIKLHNEFKLNELLLPCFLFSLVIMAYLCPAKSSIRTEMNKEPLMVKTNDESNSIKNEETRQKDNKQQSVYFEIDMNDKPDFKYLIYWPDKQVELIDELKELNATISIDERIRKVMIWPSDKDSQQVKSGEWQFKLNTYLSDLEETYETKIIKIKNPTSTVDRLTYNRLRINFVKQDDLLWESSFEIAGFIDDVTSLIKKIEEENKKSF